MNRESILLVDDDKDAVESLSRALRAHGLEYDVLVASTAEKALAAAELGKPMAAVVDLFLNEAEGVESGFSVIKSLHALDRTCRIIVLTGHGSVPHGVRALSLGAASFIEKPADIAHLTALIRDGISQSSLHRAYVESKSRELAVEVPHLKGKSPSMKSLYEELAFAASTLQPVLITGETGTGKGLCARAIHAMSKRKNAPFVRYQPNFSTADLVNSDLFGHVKGSFTGAAGDRKGLIAEADGGTLFLDEVDELPLEAQVSLLGVLQEKTFRPLGSSKEERSDFRLICASNADVGKALESGKVRKDFFHRVSHIKVHVPPLRERFEDIGPLSDYFLERLRGRDEVNVINFSEAARERLSHYAWPGNVRELEAVIESGAYRAHYRGGVFVEAEDVLLGDAAHSAEPRGFHEEVEAFKRRLVHAALKANDGNQVKAAASLGLDRTSLRRILSRSGKE